MAELGVSVLVHATVVACSRWGGSGGGVGGGGGGDGVGWGEVDGERVEKFERVWRYVCYRASYDIIYQRDVLCIVCDAVCGMYYALFVMR